jgi:hypothetical protein
MTITSFQIIAPSTALPGGPPGVQGPPGAFVVFGINNQTGVSYTIAGTDTGKMILFSGQSIGVALTLQPITGLPGWWAVVKNKNISGVITATATGGALIDGQSSMTIDPNCSAQIIFTGLNFETFGPSDGGTF